MAYNYEYKQLQHNHRYKEWWKRVSIPICSMEDSHLENTINFFLSKLENMYAIYRWGWDAWESIEDLALGIDREELKEEMKEKIRIIYERLPFYIMEAVVRWMEFSEKLQEAFWRKQMTKKIANIRALTYEVDSVDCLHDNW